MISITWKDIRDKILNTENLFMVGLFLYLIQSFLSKTTVSTRFGSAESIYQMIRYISYGFMLLSLCGQMISQKFLFVIFVSAVLMLLIAHKTTDKTLLFILIVTLAGYHQDYKKILKMSFWVYFVLFLLTLILGFAGVIPDYVSDLLTRERNFFGFTWATIPQTYIFFITMLYVCVREEKVTYGELIILALIGFIFFRYTDARFVYLIDLLFLMIVFLLKLFRIRSIRNGALQKIILCLPVVIGVLTIATYYMYDADSAFWQEINRILTSRMSLGSGVLSQYGISFLGQHIVLKGHNVNSITLDNSLYNYVDSSYLQITLLYGVAGMGLILGGITYLVWKCLKEDKMYLLTSIFCILLLSVTEDSLLKMGFNVFVLIFASVYRDQRESEKECRLTGDLF